uniref:CSON013269 protein n=1 Tax=Culicoides sonorensis TaxID=179676 RepID=A0A336MAB5_CULSO
MNIASLDEVKKEPELQVNHLENGKKMEHESEEYLHYNTFDRDLKLLEVYKTYPQLYDREHPDFRFATRKENAWRQLSKDVGIPLETCRKRITYIRARFTVERRLIKNGQHSDWPLMERLKFLHKHIQMRRLRDDNNDCEIDFDDENNQASSTSFTQMNQSMKRAFPNLDNSDEQPNNIRAKRHQPHQPPQLDDFDGHTTLSPTPYGMPHHMPIIPEVSTTEIGHRDKHAIFGEYVAEVLRRLPKSMQPQTTMKLMSVVIEAQEQELDQSTSQGSNSTAGTTVQVTENGAK